MSKNKIRVVYYCPSEGLYGDNIALLNIMPYLKDLGIEPFFIVADKGSFADNLKKCGYNHYISYNRAWNMFSLNSFLKNWLFYWLRLIRNKHKLELNLKECHTAISHFKPHLVHSNSSNSSFGFLLAKKLGVPHVWHLREFGRYDSNLEFFPSKSHFIKRIASHFNHCVSITPQVYAYFGSGKNNKVIYDGAIKNNNRPPIKIRTKKQILFVGRLVELKGIFSVIKAFEKICKLHNDIRLNIAGTGDKEYVEMLMSFVKQNKIDDRVTFLGYVTNIQELMSESLAIIVASEFEAFGFITVEAMFNGCLVIGHDIGGTKIQLDNGVEVTGGEIGLRYNSEQELISRITEVTSNNWDLYLPMLTRAQDTVIELYMAESSAKNLYAYYGEILKSEA